MFILLCLFFLSLVNCNLILAHLSRKLRGELIEKQSSRRPTVRPCMRPSSINTFKHQYLSDQRVDCNQILPEALLGRGKCCIRFWQDRTRTLFSMATDSFHRVIMGKTVLPLFSAVFHLILFILAGNNDICESLEEFEIRRDSTIDCGVSCPTP